MNKSTHFSEKVASELKCYVYRLIDPRNGATFYVGRGRGDRVFAHAAERPDLKRNGDDESLKLGMIRAIRSAGLEVEHVIHRHGMDETTAAEVEAALIDAYPGLANLLKGSGSDRGVMHAREIVRKYEAEPVVFKHDVILINVNQTSGHLSLYDAVRYRWKISEKRARQAKYVLAVRKGLIIGVFEPSDWLPATPENFPGLPEPDSAKWGFCGRQAPEEIRKLYVDKRAPEQKRGAANPIRYGFAKLPSPASA